jgi:hypothetical protein
MKKTLLITGLLGILAGCENKDSSSQKYVPSNLPVARLPAGYVGSSPYISISDMNNDGRPDIVASVNGSDGVEVYILYNKGDGAYSTKIPDKK